MKFENILLPLTFKNYLWRETILLNTVKPHLTTFYKTTLSNWRRFIIRCLMIRRLRICRFIIRCLIIRRLVLCRFTRLMISLLVICRLMICHLINRPTHTIRFCKSSFSKAIMINSVTINVVKTDSAFSLLTFLWTKRNKKFN